MNPSIFTSVINNYLPEPQSSLLNGIIFGLPLKTSKILYEQLKIVGLLHIVVLSGINITLLATIVSLLTASLGKKISTIVTIIVIILFVIFVGAQPPIIRAAFMGILAFIAILYGRKNSLLYSLFLSIIFIALFWPKWLTSVSFQLSYGATLGIILFGTANQTKSWLWKELRPSLAAQLFTTPIIFLYFKQISLIAPLSNLLVAPVIPPLMVFGFATAILGKLNFYLGLLPGLICFGLLSYILLIIKILARLPFVYFKF